MSNVCECILPAAERVQVEDVGGPLATLRVCLSSIQVGHVRAMNLKTMKRMAVAALEVEVLEVEVHII